MVLKYLKIALELSKIRIPVAVSLSSLTAWVLFSKEINTPALLMLAGVFLLSSGSAAINHIQEFRLDKKMGRTKERPLASGRTGISFAWIFALILVLAGSWILYYHFGWLASALGILSLIWYNLIYTPLKRVTPFALLLGSVVGTIPPMIGWVAAGGDLLHESILALSFLYFVWQVPHFLLILLKFGEEYIEAGFRPLNRYMSQQRMAAITFIWVVALGVITTSLPLFIPLNHEISLYLFMLLAILLMIVFLPLLRLDKNLNFKRLFAAINIFIVIVVLLLIGDTISS